jgi:hypothetical protein
VRQKISLGLPGVRILPWGTKRNFLLKRAKDFLPHSVAIAIQFTRNSNQKSLIKELTRQKQPTSCAKTQQKRRRVYKEKESVAVWANF